MCGRSSGRLNGRSSGWFNIKLNTELCRRLSGRWSNSQSGWLNNKMSDLNKQLEWVDEQQVCIGSYGQFNGRFSKRLSNIQRNWMSNKLNAFNNSLSGWLSNKLITGLCERLIGRLNNILS